MNNFQMDISLKKNKKLIFLILLFGTDRLQCKLRAQKTQQQIAIHKLNFKLVDWVDSIELKMCTTCVYRLNDSLMN